MRDRKMLVLAILFLAASVLLFAAMVFGQTVQLSPGPVLLTSMPQMEEPK